MQREISELKGLMEVTGGSGAGPPYGEVEGAVEHLAGDVRDIKGDLRVLLGLILGAYVVIAGSYLLLANKMDAINEKLSGITSRLESITARLPQAQQTAPAQARPQQTRKTRSWERPASSSGRTSAEGYPGSQVIQGI